MIFVENNNMNPYRNHALEEWLIGRFDEDCFMLWRNEKAVLLGRNQNVYNEINLPYIREHGISIVRRLTGGGAVFTDEENLMFTFISGKERQEFADFKKFTTPIIEALLTLGIRAEFSGRNDITIEGKKISGNAQCVYHNKVLHHGTLMYKANTAELVNALKVSKIKLQSKGVDSVRSRVTNIAEYMEEPMDIEEFRQYLLTYVKGFVKDAKTYRLSDEDWKEVEKIRLDKHSTDEWIYGTNPDFNVEREVKVPGGIIQIYVNVHKGNIVGCRIFGDFFSNGELYEIENALKGVLYKAENIREVLQGFDIAYYFKDITIDELLAAIV